MVKGKYSKLDWQKFIEDLSEIKDDLARELFFIDTRKRYIKEIPDFTRCFVSRLKDVSFKLEREPYYKALEISSEIIALIEDSFGLPIDSLHDDIRIKIMTEIIRMQKWSLGKNSGPNLTLLWSSGNNFYGAPKEEWSLRDRLFILTTLINFDVLPILEDKNGSRSNINMRWDRFYDLIEGGGDRLAKSLSVVLNEPYSTIGDLTENKKKARLRDYLDFYKLKYAHLSKQEKYIQAGIWVKSLDRIINLFKDQTESNKYSNKNPGLGDKLKLINDYLSTLKEAYEDMFS